MALHKILANNPFIVSRFVPALAILVFINNYFNILIDRKDLLYTESALPQNKIVYRFMLSPITQQRVILLGSSVMDTPFSRYNKNIYYSYLARASTTEKHLQNDTNQKIGVANLCLEASMISDQYILIKKYLSTRSPLPVIVLGITPRDFIDQRFRQPEETASFRILVTLADFDLWPSYVENMGRFLKFALNQSSLSFRYRSILTYQLSQEINKRLPTFCNTESQQNVSTNVRLPQPENKSETRFQSSLQEYAGIYSDKGNGPTYYCQMNFLKQLLNFCHQYQIPLLLINMPLTTANKNLMAPGFYQKFEEAITRLANENKINFINAAENSEFKDNEDYWDCAHLNAIGGEKLNGLMCPLIEKMLRTDEKLRTKHIRQMPQ